MKVVTQLCQHFANRQDKPLTSFPPGEAELLNNYSTNQLLNQPKKPFTKAFKSVHAPLKKCSRREHFLTKNGAKWLGWQPPKCTHMKKNEVF
jgi:hypothetical protein